MNLNGKEYFREMVGPHHRLSVRLILVLNYHIQSRNIKSLLVFWKSKKSLLCFVPQANLHL